MTTTKIFWDTEFTGLHKKTTLISIGFTAESGETFYAEFTDYDKSQVDDWIQKNVIDRLLMNDVDIYPSENYIEGKDSNRVSMKGDTAAVRQELITWFRQFDHVQMWSDCLAYDWVLFCDIFGSAFDIPKNIYYIPFDICTLMLEKGVDPDINREEFSENTLFPNKKHTAYFDSWVIRACYNKLIKFPTAAEAFNAAREIINWEHGVQAIEKKYNTYQDLLDEKCKS